MNAPTLTPWEAADRLKILRECEELEGRGARMDAEALRMAEAALRGQQAAPPIVPPGDQTPFCAVGMPEQAAPAVPEPLNVCVHDESIGMRIPAEIIHAAQTVSVWFKSRGIEWWKLGGIQSRDDATHAPAVPDGYTPVKTSVLRWLLGEEGEFECPHSRYFRAKPTPFFWRHDLRAAMLAAAPAPATAPATPVAPWPDFKGNPIRHGDHMRHPDGMEFVAVRLSGFENENDAWRAIYGRDQYTPPFIRDPITVSRLSLQIDYKGRAVVVGQAPEKGADL